MINLLQSLREIHKPNGEDGYFYVRFNDFSSRVQSELINLIKNQSSIWTLKKEKEDGSPMITQEEMRQIMTCANPVIFDQSKNYCQKTFITRWKEKKMSHIIYHLWRVAFKKRKPIERAIENIIENWIIRAN